MKNAETKIAETDAWVVRYGAAQVGGTTDPVGGQVARPSGISGNDYEAV